LLSILAALKSSTNLMSESILTEQWQLLPFSLISLPLESILCMRSNGLCCSTVWLNTQHSSCQQSTLFEFAKEFLLAVGLQLSEVPYLHAVDTNNEMQELLAI